MLKTTVQLCRHCRGTIKVQRNARQYTELSRPERTSFTKRLWTNRMRDINEAIDKYESYGNIKDLESKKPLAKRMHESYVEGILPFTTDETVREDYMNSFGGIRLGKILEDLDAMSGAIAYAHCDDRDHRTLPLAIVTASVDRIDLLNPLEIDRDMKLSGNVTYVGSSSMEITVRVESSLKDGEERVDSDQGYIPILLARFSFVARDPNTGKAARVNTLALTSALEHSIFEAGRKAKDRASSARKTDLSKVPPTAQEGAYIHATWASNFNINEMSPAIKADTTVPRQTQLSRTLIAHPAQRNLRNNVFGGYLMKESYDLAFITANLHLSHRPRFLSSSQLTFAHPVPIGSILEFRSRIVLQNESSFCVTVTADTISSDHARQNTSTFHYTFARTQQDGVLPGKELVAESYGDAMRMVAARRREAKVLDRAEQLRLFKEQRIDPMAIL